MNKFSVNELAILAGVSVRTLHHYDKINLLKPSVRAASGYRYYGEQELLRLQQILLYKELDFSLQQIKLLLDDSEFDLKHALQHHKQELQKRAERLNQLIQTVDSTIAQLKNNNNMDYNQMYKGFDREQMEAYKKEASEKWGKENIDLSEQKILHMSVQDWDALKERGEYINQSLAAHMHLDPADVTVQELIQQHYILIGHYLNTLTPDIYRNLGTMYVEDKRFTETYDAYKQGLAVFIRDAIYVFCGEK